VQDHIARRAVSSISNPGDNQAHGHHRRGAHVLNQAKRYAEAESLVRELLAIFEVNHIPDNDGRRAESLFELGTTLVGQKKSREAAEVLNRSAAIYEAVRTRFHGRAGCGNAAPDQIRGASHIEALRYEDYCLWRKR
jgi:hypothetical protein